MIYNEFERKFPNHQIIQKDGIFYNAYNVSARVIYQALHLEIREGYVRVTTGTINRGEIIDALKQKAYSFILFENGVITERYDALFPFAGYKEEKTYLPKCYETKATLSTTSYPINLLLRIYKDEFPNLQLTLSDLPEDILQRLDCFFSTLNPRKKEIMVLRFKDYKSYQEIGDILGTSRQAVQAQVSDIIERIRKDAYFKHYIRKEIIRK